MWRLPYSLILLYRRFLSPLLAPACRFTPSCSLYAAESLRRHGFWKGSWLAIKRLARCFPWHPGGFDPVPPPAGCHRIGEPGHLAPGEPDNG